MKPNQDPSDLFEALAAIEHAYSGTQEKVEENDLTGAVFATTPEKYHTVLTLTAAAHGKGWNWIILKMPCATCSAKVMGSQVE